MSQKPVVQTPKEHFQSERLVELGSLIKRIERIPYFKPDGKPKKEWKVFYAPTWGEAWRLAKKALEEKDFEQVSKGQPSIENVNLSCANQQSKVFSFLSSELLENTAGLAYDVACKAVKRETDGWEWNKKRYERASEEERKVDPNYKGPLKVEVANALLELLADLSDSCPNPKARESAIESAGEDASAMGRLILAEKHPYFFHRERHLIHVNARIEVWEKGYGLAGDDCGVLYVYCRGRPPEEQFLRSSLIKREA